MERDYVGYGRNVPIVKWPNDARLALSLVVNYEEGAEKNIEDGDKTPEKFGEIAYAFSEPIRDLANETIYAYGSRVGFWRLMDMFDKYGVNVTVYACAVALEKNLEAAREIVKKKHELCSHGYRWDEHYYMTRDEELESIRKAIHSFQQTTGIRPYGWCCRYAPSIYTRELLASEGFIYDSDSYADDIPYVTKVKGRDWVVVPYTFDINDFHFWLNRFSLSDDFFQYLKDSFDCLYEESKKTPRMMSVGLHPRIIGRPGRIAGLERFIKYVKGFPDVWFAKRIEIAQWWYDHYV